VTSSGLTPADADRRDGAEADGGCPVAHGLSQVFLPYSAEYIRDPYAVFERARSEEPVFYAPDIDHWVVSRYESVRSIIMNPSDFANYNIARPPKPWAPSAIKLFQEANVDIRPTLNTIDGTLHANIRKFLRFAFTPRRLEWIKDFTLRHVTEHIGRVIDRGHGDLVADLFYDVPAEVVFDFLGVPGGDVRKIKAWSNARALLTWGRASEEEQLAAIPLYLEFFRYCMDRVDALERDPGSDYVSELLQQWNRGDHPEGVDRHEIVMILFTILMAGHETTTNASANGMRAILTQRDQWDLLCSDPSLVPNAVEEMLRYDTSVFTWRRITTKDVEVDGVHIPAGEQVLILLGSANRDDEHFPEARRLDIRRQNARQHLSFTAGTHFCLGAPLARLEMVIMFEQLSQRMPKLRLVEGQPFGYPANLTLRGPQRLLVNWR
jgi:cytochrome P450